jgi:hypothetical protein
VYLRSACFNYQVLTGEAKARFSTHCAERYKSSCAPAKFAQKKYLKLRDGPLRAAALISIIMKRQASGDIPEVVSLAWRVCLIA